MAFTQLIHRLFGMTAICLAAVLVPVTPVQRMLVLTALGLGVGTASVMPDYDRSAARIVGPAVLVLALAPVTGVWGVIDLGAAALIGFASFNQGGMSRAVPALGLPLMTLVFRSGQPVPRMLFLAWVGAVVLTIIWGGRANLIGSGPRLGWPAEQEDRGLVFGWRRIGHSVAAVLIITPLSVLLATGLDRIWPDALIAPPRPGDLSGPSATTHPGLTGGLDAGEPVVLDDDVVLRVKADRPQYWRGTTYSNWDGRRWTSDIERRDLASSGVAVDLSPLLAGDGAAIGFDDGELPPPTTVMQQFRLERAGLDVALGAWQMTSLRIPGQAASLGDDGSVVLKDSMGAGATWTVESQVVPATEDDLRRADPAMLPADHSIIQRFAVEEDVVPGVAELARAITAEAPTTYDKVRALEDWMDDNITYTRAIDRLAPGSDAVHHLLFESRVGFCEQIGTALVVMLRSLGIPARLVVGYVPGEYDGATGEWISRGTDAHAWAEVFFPGVGWQGFDPTAGVPLGPSAPSPWPASTWPLILSAVLGLIAVVALTIRQYSGSFRLFGRRKAIREDPMAELWRRFDRCGADLARTWDAVMTTREKGQDLVAAGVDPEVVTLVVSEFEQVLFYRMDREGIGDLDLDALTDDIDRLERCVQLVAPPNRVHSGR